MAEREKNETARLTLLHNTTAARLAELRNATDVARALAGAAEAKARAAEQLVLLPHPPSSERCTPSFLSTGMETR